MKFGNIEYRDSADIKSYHVHLYYDGASKQNAGNLRREINNRFGNDVVIGRWRDKAPQGPHPVSHFQVEFPVSLFDKIVPFLALNRGRISILLHPNTGNGYEDHTKNVMWIGPSVDLNDAWLVGNKQ
ncbi:MAG: DOPA 4,5-dioxygenase family protein [Rhodospirillales bacterium]|tara:strand:+ start:5 stop:385 length:381 start_codon:yes stop_codon:yes gene_type:complete